MEPGVYKAGHRNRQRRSRRKLWLPIVVIVLAIIAGGAWFVAHLKSKTVITQARPTVTHINYAATTKHYSEPDFSIDLPTAWQPLPRPTGPYQTYNWQLVSKGSADTISIYEDTIPVNFAVNQVLIVEGNNTQINVKGTASDNCSAYTSNAPSNAYAGGAPAKWQNVNFLCDQNNSERDVLGTSSTDGVNSVILKSPGTGRQHKFFFTYTAHSLNPDFTPFYNALASFSMK